MNDYRSAGVDTEKSAQFIRNVAPMIKSTSRKGADAEVGGFGGFFDLKACGFDDPLLVAATDGVGTKLRLAIETGCHDTIGIDLVAMCVNDLIVQGAEPLFFLDYFAQGKLLSPEILHDIVAGIVAGCTESGCALIGGETAEMPGMYQDGDYDLAGFSVGAVERNKVVSPKNTKVGDILIGLASSGFHSNGYSLIRKVVADCDLTEPAPFASENSLGKELLTPTRIYVKDLLPHTASINGMWHITGGGFYENLERGIDAELAMHIDQIWTIPKSCSWLAKKGDIAPVDMLSTFNCGIGMVLAVPPSNTESICQALNGTVIGQVKRRDQDTVIVDNTILNNFHGA